MGKNKEICPQNDTELWIKFVTVFNTLLIVIPFFSSQLADIIKTTNNNSSFSFFLSSYLIAKTAVYAAVFALCRL